MKLNEVKSSLSRCTYVKDDIACKSSSASFVCTEKVQKHLQWLFLHFFCQLNTSVHFSLCSYSFSLSLRPKNLSPCPLEKPIIRLHHTHSLLRASRPRNAPGSTVLIKLFFRSLGKRNRKKKTQSRQLNQWLFTHLSLLAVCTDIKWWLDITFEVKFTELMIADLIHPCLSRKQYSFKMHMRMFILLTE